MALLLFININIICQNFKYWKENVKPYAIADILLAYVAIIIKTY
jgi:hypothetical protein